MLNFFFSLTYFHNYVKHELNLLKKNISAYYVFDFFFYLHFFLTFFLSNWSLPCDDLKFGSPNLSPWRIKSSYILVFFESGQTYTQWRGKGGEGREGDSAKQCRGGRASINMIVGPDACSINIISIRIAGLMFEKQLIYGTFTCHCQETHNVKRKYHSTHIRHLRLTYIVNAYFELVLFGIWTWRKHGKLPYMQRTWS